MLCERCKQNNATIYVNEYKDGKVTESYLCSECAKVKNSISDFTQSAFQSFLTGLLEMGIGKTIQCPNCKMTDEEFRKLGRFGCSTCYETFGETLENTLKRIQPGNKHIGKVPERFAHIIITKKEIENLKQQLSKAVEEEEYEKAATLRDQIKELERGGEKDE